jgi:hypothetical protein
MAIIKRLATFKLSLLLKSYLQRTQTLYVNQKWKVLIKTMQRSLACFIQVEPNEEKLKRFD